MGFFKTQELLKIATPPWLVYKVLPGYGLALLYGAPETGKSFVAIDWALCVATGTPWRGHRVKQGHVVYIASEGGEGIKKRVAAWMDHHQVEDIPEAQWYLDTLDFRNQDEIDAFMDGLQSRYPDKREYEHTIQSFVTTETMDLKLIVVDTLARNFGDADENSFQAMQPFIDALQAFAEKSGVLILLVHHTNALGERERGHSSLRGAINVAFMTTCTRDEATGQMDEVILRNDKQKDDARAVPFTFTPRVYPLPMLPPDEEGEVLSTLVLEPRTTKKDIMWQVVSYVRANEDEELSQTRIIKGLHPVTSLKVREAIEEAMAQGLICCTVRPHNRHVYELSPYI